MTSAVKKKNSLVNYRYLHNIFSTLISKKCMIHSQTIIMHEGMKMVHGTCIHRWCLMRNNIRKVSPLIHSPLFVAWYVLLFVFSNSLQTKIWLLFFRKRVIVWNGRINCFWHIMIRNLSHKIQFVYDVNFIWQIYAWYVPHILYQHLRISIKPIFCFLVYWLNLYFDKFRHVLLANFI